GSPHPRQARGGHAHAGRRDRTPRSDHRLGPRMADADHRETEQVLAAEQDERRRIALFLHDGPVQSLAGAALMLDASLDLIERGDLDEARSILDRALIRTRSTVGELRDLSFNLEPVVLRDHGFAAALDALGESRAREHEFDVTFDVAAV